MPVLFQDEFRISTTRLPGWDYSEPGSYFVTICTKGMKCDFGEVQSGEVLLNNAGKIAQENWLGIPLHHNNVILDIFVIMPNHIHGILMLSDIESSSNQAVNVETLHATSLRADLEKLNPSFFSKISPKKDSLSTIIRSYKSSTTRLIHQLLNASFAWQPRFYDHIIRTETDLQNLREYIHLNPSNWHKNITEIPPLEARLHAL